jgi:protoporphyrin/coproporphyrin ferrochelatase
VTTGVVVMAYGSPATPDDVEAYYTHIRRGRPPTPELLADLRSRYDAIGGLSPLRAITEAQVQRIEVALGDDFSVMLGYKHAMPFIEDAVGEAVAAGAEEVIGVVLAPHDSRGSVGEYVERMAAAADQHGVTSAAIRSWHDLPEWRTFQAVALRSQLQEMPGRTKVLFTAHSLPDRVLAGDVYVDELWESASAVAAEAGLAPWAGWGMAWQSAGRTGEPWRGPDITQVLTDLAETGRAEGALVCPQGFTADGLELRYDLDIAAAEHARTLGLAFGRTPMVNDDAQVLTALAERVRRSAFHEPGAPP